MYCIPHTLFLTYDEGLLNKKTQIEDKYPIQIYNPQEFIIHIDQLLHEEEYLPNQLKGIYSDSISKLNSQELSSCIDKFWTQKMAKTNKPLVLPYII